MTNSTTTLDTEWYSLVTYRINGQDKLGTLPLSSIEDKALWSLLSLIEIELESRKPRFLEG